MPLLDVNNPLSEDWAQAYALRARLSECSAAQLLFDESTAAGALDHIEVGAGAPSGFGETFTLAELEQRNAWAQIIPPDEEGAVWFEDDAAEEGQFQNAFTYEIWLRWQVPAISINSDGINGVTNFFWDVVSALPQQLRDAVRVLESPCPRIRNARRLGLRWGEREEESAQGFYMEAELSIDTGDLSQ